MCLYPRLIRNRKYVVNNKNNGNVPELKDPRVGTVSAGCGKCMECRKQKARGWSIRLQEEIRQWHPKHRHFVTLTFSNEAIHELKNALEPGLTGYNLDNAIATIGMRRFLERWRKLHKKSLKHWAVTELGHNGTENIHLHAILLTKHTEDIKPTWKYGHVYIGDYVTEQTVNYICKYITKIDQQHKEYNPKILTSPGIGKAYLDRLDAKLNTFKDKDTDECYYTRTGEKIALPTYYRNKLYTEDQREELWKYKLDKLQRWVDGSKIDISKDDKTYWAVLEEARKKNKRLGYGDDQIDWDRLAYENKLREINLKKRLEKLDT